MTIQLEIEHHKDPAFHDQYKWSSLMKVLMFYCLLMIQIIVLLDAQLQPFSKI